MRQTTIAVICSLTFILLFSGCKGSQKKVVSAAVEALDDSIFALSEKGEYAAAAALIDSVEKVGAIPASLIAGERGVLLSKDRQYRKAELLFNEALADKALKREYYSCYLRLTERIVDNQINLHKWEEALRLAQQVCEETRNSTSLAVQEVALLMYGYIGSCQIRLHNWQEAMTITERAYKSSLDYERQDPAASSITFRLALTFLESYHFMEKWEEGNLWVNRAQDALERVPCYRDNPKLYDNWSGYLYSMECVSLKRLGQDHDAALAYQKFLNTKFSRGLGGINGVNYLAATGQWAKMERLLPIMDSLVVSTGAEMIPKYLSDRYRYQYMTYRHVGKKDNALAIADSMFKNLDKAIENERLTKALDLATFYETREKESMLRDKDAQLSRIWTASVAGVLLLFVLALTGFVVINRRSEKQLKAEHQKLLDAYEQLMQANERAKESSKMKSSFIKQISHEIRTPLNVLSGYTQILTTPGIFMDEKTKADANKSIISNTNRITKLVNKMLELSDISTKTVIERSDRVQAVQLADQAISDSGIQKHDTVCFEYHIDEDVRGIELETNRRSAVRSLVLLLDNARKFLVEPNEEPKGLVALRVEMDEDKTKINYIIEDSGIGVPPSESERIFDEFVQLNDFYDGTGIGLSVARSLVRRIGGDIKLDASYRLGARFIVSLPL